MYLSYVNFLRAIIVFAIAVSVFLSQNTGIQMVAGSILSFAIIVEVLCVLRLTSLGYGFAESFKRLFLKGDKILVFLNKIPNKSHE
jgi:hypothetical protein